MEGYVCKFVILERRVLGPIKRTHHRDPGDRVAVVATPAKRCLFGVADPKETERMLREQLEEDRRRFSERFGFDPAIEIGRFEGEEEEGIGNEENVAWNGNGGRKDRKVLKAKRRNQVKGSRSQTVMTDFYQARKHVQSTPEVLKDLAEDEEK